MADSKLPAGIRRRGGKYVVTGYDPTRKARGSVHVATVTSLAEARKRKAEFEASKARVQEGHTTVAEWAEIWVHEPRWQRVLNGGSLSTDVHNHAQIRPFVRDFGDMAVAEVTRPLASLWVLGGRAPSEFARVAARWEGVKVAGDGTVTVPAHRSSLAAVRAMFTDAMQALSSVPGNPFHRMAVPRLKAGRKNLPWLQTRFDDAVADLERLCDAAIEAHGPEYGREFAALIRFAAYSGMRPSEMWGLRWTDVDFKRRRITVERQRRSKLGDYALPKNGKPREIVLFPEAAAALGVLRPNAAVRDDAIFLTGKHRKPYHSRLHHYYWDPVRRAFGRPDMEFYELRHFCGSYLASQGGSAMDIAIQLGHEDGGRLAQELYIHTARQDALSRLERLIEPGEEVAGA